MRNATRHNIAKMTAIAHTNLTNALIAKCDKDEYEALLSIWHTLNTICKENAIDYNPLCYADIDENGNMYAACNVRMVQTEEE